MPPARVVQLMNAGAGDARMLAAGARALVELTGGDGLFAARGAALAARGVNHEARCAECIGAVPLLVRALDSPPAECAVACRALRNIASFDAQNDACAEAGAIPALVGALTRHAGEAGVCQNASGALQNITLTSDAHRDACAAAGAISALVGALTRHAGEAGVCERASGALRNIAAGNSGGRLEDACAAAGAIPALVSALTRHAGVAVVCQKASGALMNITNGSDARKDACASAGAIPALVGALTRHAGLAFVCQYASGALLCIVWTSPAHRRAAVAAGAVPCLSAAWSAHPSAKTSAHGALEKLGYRDNGSPL
jgi:hypothetical protein